MGQIVRATSLVNIRVSVAADNIMGMDSRDTYRPTAQFEEWSEAAFGQVYYPVIAVGEEGWQAFLEFENIRDAILFKMRWA